MIFTRQNEERKVEKVKVFQFTFSRVELRSSFVRQPQKLESIFKALVEAIDFMV